jgi:homocitrate synthase NifV
VVGLEKLHGIRTGIDLKGFLALSSSVAHASGRAVPWQKSVVGPGAFTHEAGIHIDGLLKHPDNYQGFDPVDVGRSHRIVLGKHSGPRAVQVVYAGLGISLGDAEASALLGHIRLFVAAHKHSPDVADLHALLASARSHRHV